MMSQEIVSKMRSWHLMYGVQDEICEQSCRKIEQELVNEGLLIGIDSDGEVILYLTVDNRIDIFEEGTAMNA